nr:MAG TPA: hypothetical protein [Caudoviricetes sp.]
MQYFKNNIFITERYVYLILSYSFRKFYYWLWTMLWVL